eukprot:g6508.t1
MDSTFDSSMWSGELPPIDMKMRGWFLADDPVWSTSRNEAMMNTAIKPSAFNAVAQSSAGSRRGSKEPPGRLESPSREDAVKYDKLMASDMVENPRELRRYQLIPDPTRRRRFPPKSPTHRAPSDFLNYKKFHETIRKKQGSIGSLMSDTSVDSVLDSVFTTSPGPLVESRSYTIHPADTYPGELSGRGGRKSLSRKKTFASYVAADDGEPAPVRDPKRMLPAKKKYDKQLLSATEQSYTARAAASEQLQGTYQPTRSRSPKPSPLASPLDYTETVASLPRYENIQVGGATGSNSAFASGTQYAGGTGATDEETATLDKQKTVGATRTTNKLGPRKKTMRDYHAMGMFGDDATGRAKAKKHAEAQALKAGEAKKGKVKVTQAYIAQGKFADGGGKKKSIAPASSSGRGSRASMKGSKSKEKEEEVLAGISREVATDVMADLFGTVEEVADGHSRKSSLKSINSLLPESERFGFSLPDESPEASPVAGGGGGGPPPQLEAQAPPGDTYTSTEDEEVAALLRHHNIDQRQLQQMLQDSAQLEVDAAGPLHPAAGSNVVFADEEEFSEYEDEEDGEAGAEARRQLLQEMRKKSGDQPGPGYYNVKPGATNWLLKPSFDLGNPGAGHYGDVAGNKVPTQAAVYMGMRPKMWQPEVNDPQIPTKTHLFRPGGPYFTIKGKLPPQKSSVCFSFQYQPGKEFYAGSKTERSNSKKEFVDEFGSVYSLDPFSVGGASKEASRFLSPEKGRGGAGISLNSEELKAVERMEARARERSAKVDHGLGDETKSYELVGVVPPHSIEDGAVLEAGASVDEKTTREPSSMQLSGGGSFFLSAGGPSKTLESRNYADGIGYDSSKDETGILTSKEYNVSTISGGRTSIAGGGGGGGGGGVSASLQTETSLMFPPTGRIEELKKQHNMSTRYKPNSYTQIGPKARNFDRYCIAANDKRTTQFTNRPEKKRMDQDQTNWYVQSSDCLISAGLRYAHPTKWDADPRKGFSILGRDDKPFSLPTAGREVPLRNMGKYNSRTTKSTANGFTWGCGSRMEERLACLEFYARLRAPEPGSREEAKGLFSIEEDHRKRTFLRLVPDKYALDGPKPQQWRCTHALPPESGTGELVETMGGCLLDWLLEGYNAVLLSMGTSGSGKTHTLLGSPEEHSTNTSANPGAPPASKAPESKHLGLLPSLLREIFRIRRQEQFRVGISWWDVRGSEVRDQNERPVFRNVTQFDVMELTSFSEGMEVLRALRDKDFYERPEHGGKLSAKKSRHLFIRLALFHAEDHLLSTVHFVDLGNEADGECRRDLGSLHELLREVGGAFSETEHDGGQSGGNVNPGGSAASLSKFGAEGVVEKQGPNMLLRSPVSPQFKSERQLGALLMPLVTGNCKTVVLVTSPETQLADAQMEETVGHGAFVVNALFGTGY